ncbi:MAG: FtsX-like permease family protein [Gammaproteobacteria bacterium]|nr:FtsX-like permease family protein [Gammaproteobacteria bacterium]
MTETALPLPATGSGTRAGAVFVVVAWRNLWRHRLRTWLAAGGVGFAILLVGVMVAFQDGIYGPWIENATSLSVGHMQVQHPGYFDDPKISHALAGGSSLVREIEEIPGVVGATGRAEAFALVSVGERSYGGLVMGVDAEREAAMFTLASYLREGEYLPRGDSAYLGSSLATNLGVELGDEIVALGSGKEGGVAALVLNVDGIFESGRADLDRTILQAPVEAVQSAFELGDSLHSVVLKIDDPERAEVLKPTVEARVPADARVLDWNELLPELKQGIRLDAISGQMMAALLIAVVAMSVVNSFIMTVFERTREFGMLIAIGMRPNAIVGMLTIEAACVWVLGAAIGIAACVAVVLPLNIVGVNMGQIVEGVDDFYAQLMVPDALRPQLSAGALLLAPGIMLAGTLLAALVPALRVRRMHPVEALREEE